MRDRSAAENFACVQGSSNESELTPFGREQAERVKEALSRMPFDRCVVHCQAPQKFGHAPKALGKRILQQSRIRRSPAAGCSEAALKCRRLQQAHISSEFPGHPRAVTVKLCSFSSGAPNDTLRYIATVTYKAITHRLGWCCVFICRIRLTAAD